ncbi:MAG: isochorismate synthase [Actinomycetota bacterium]|nr:isochorismate synthase [Actinomycetota bacterium]
MTTASIRSLRIPVRSVAIDDPGPLLALLPDAAPLAWLRQGDGLVGWGKAARFEAGLGTDRFGRAEAWWADMCRTLDVVDEVGLPGSGPVAFGSFTFDAGSAGSVLVVPQVVLGRRDGRSWLTTVGAATGVLGPVGEPPRPARVRYADGSLSAIAWQEAVREAVAAIRAGRLEKVVLSRDLLATSDTPLDPRFLLQRLAARFPACWTFSCAGLVGSTPELLVRREGARVESGVLAGSVRRGRDAAEDAELGAWLLASAKDDQEHAISVRSVSKALAPHCGRLDVPARPRLLQLANVQHLATDITGLLTDGATALGLVNDLHPTAAVCGTPTDVAAGLISTLEGMDRGRFTGPVGWTGADGDGEWGIALRCAELAGPSARLFAGCGIVADSDPDAELAEAQVKLAAMRDALEGV